MSKNSQKSTCARVSILIKPRASTATLLKRRILHGCVSVNFAKFLGTPFYRTPPDDSFYKNSDFMEN